MQQFYEEVSKWRKDLELQSIDSSNTRDTVSLVTYVQTLKKHVQPYQEQVRTESTSVNLTGYFRWTDS